MRTTLLTALLALLLSGYVRASGAVTIEINTTDVGATYTLHRQGYAPGNVVTTPDEIEDWLRLALKQIGDREPIFIYSDDRTSFRAVVDMLRRFKVAGVKRFVVCTGTGAGVRPALSASFDDFHLHGFDTNPPPK